MGRKPVLATIQEAYAEAEVFFLTDEQQATLHKALDHAEVKKYVLSKAIRRRRALIKICNEYLENHNVH